MSSAKIEIIDDTKASATAAAAMKQPIAAAAVASAAAAVVAGGLTKRARKLKVKKQNAGSSTRSSADVNLVAELERIFESFPVHIPRVLLSIIIGYMSLLICIARYGCDVMDIFSP
jgi:hypothetical protein